MTTIQLLFLSPVLWYFAMGDDSIDAKYKLCESTLTNQPRIEDGYYYNLPEYCGIMHDDFIPCLNDQLKFAVEESYLFGPSTTILVEMYKLHKTPSLLRHIRFHKYMCSSSYMNKHDFQRLFIDTCLNADELDSDGCRNLPKPKLLSILLKRNA